MYLRGKQEEGENDSEEAEAATPPESFERGSEDPEAPTSVA